MQEGKDTACTFMPPLGMGRSTCCCCRKRISAARDAPAAGDQRPRRSTPGRVHRAQDGETSTLRVEVWSGDVEEWGGGIPWKIGEILVHQRLS